MNQIALYTKEQLLLFYDKAQALERKRRTDFIGDVRAAVWAESEDLEQLIDALER